MVEQADVIVVGLGVGGEAVAGSLAEAGLSVVGIEQRLVGGECPYYGCIPSKMMVRAANLLTEARRVPGLAGHAVVEPDWAPVARRIRAEATDSWDDSVAVRRLAGKGVRFVRGTGRLVGAGRVMADRVVAGDLEFHAKRGVVISTGTAPVVPPIEGLAGTPYWTNRDAIQAERLPSSIIILGGGAIGLELRAGLRPVRGTGQRGGGAGPALGRRGAGVLRAGGRGAGPRRRRHPHRDHGRPGRPRRRRVHADPRPRRGRTPQQYGRRHGPWRPYGWRYGPWRYGRWPRHAGGGRAPRRHRPARRGLDGLGLDTVGIGGPGSGANAGAGRFVAVDDRLRAADRLWAVGDITGKGGFTHVAMYQAGVVVADILGKDGPAADYRALPRVTFTDPEIGAVGLTERQARERGIAVRVGVGQVPHSSRGWIHKAGNEGLIKVVVDDSRGVLVGATSAGPMGGEVLSALCVAVHAEVPIHTLRHMIFAYPTFHRGLLDALGELR